MKFSCNFATAEVQALLKSWTSQHGPSYHATNAMRLIWNKTKWEKLFLLGKCTGEAYYVKGTDGKIQKC